MPKPQMMVHPPPMVQQTLSEQMRTDGAPTTDGHLSAKALRANEMLVDKKISNASTLSRRTNGSHTSGNHRTCAAQTDSIGQQALQLPMAVASVMCLVALRMVFTAVCSVLLAERYGPSNYIHLGGLVVDVLYLLLAWQAYCVFCATRVQAFQRGRVNYNGSQGASVVCEFEQLTPLTNRRNQMRSLEVSIPPLAEIQTMQIQSLSRQTSSHTAGRVPNQVLFRALNGATTDMKAVRRIAERIRDSSYTLRMFHHDCLQCFPEIRLFFVGASTEVVVRTSSGVSDEFVYQRTMGALFAVYWLCRLGVNGTMGLAYGVNEDWACSPPKRRHAPKKPFVQMTDEERRACFLQNMDWSRLSQLITRAGIGEDAGSDGVERIVVLLCLTVLHDLMKVQALQPILQPEHAPFHGHQAGVRLTDHNKALAYVLENFPTLLPSYSALSPEQQKLIFFFQGGMRFNYGWFVQAEAPPGLALSRFKEVMEEGVSHADIDLYFVHWLAEMAGASGTPLGGAEKLVLQLPHEIVKAFLWSMPFICRVTVMCETDLMEQYLEARWTSITERPVPTGPPAIALMRLVLMAQDNPHKVMDAFYQLGPVDQECLADELARTGVKDQHFSEHAVHSGPAFLVYYAPALLQGAIGDQRTLRMALHIFCVVLRAARALWPLSARAEGETVTIKITDLKDRPVDEILKGWGQTVWVLLYQNNQEGVVCLKNLGQFNNLCSQGARFRLLDFGDTSVDPVSMCNPMEAVNHLVSVDGYEMLMSRMSTTAGPGAMSPRVSRHPSQSSVLPVGMKGHDPFKDSIRMLIFADMSTECDDECAFLWLVQALNRKPYLTTVELVMTDSHVRYQWMGHIFSDKFASGEWQLAEDGSSFLAGKVLVRLYLAHSPEREPRVIADIHQKAPHVHLDVREVDGKMRAIRQEGTLGGVEDSCVPGGKLACILVAAAIPNVSSSFFEGFTDVRCVYVVGTPGGVNCPLPSWVGLLAALHRLAPVVYLTPQLTRTVRFPRNYVLTNPAWNENIRHTVWDATLTFMARRPEIPPKFGDWGLMLRLNAANAMFCRDWYADVMNTSIDDAERPESCIQAAQSYVDRSSGDDRAPGAVMEELRALNVDVSPEALGLRESDFEGGKPGTPEARQAIREVYRQQLYEAVLCCVMATEKLLFANPRNKRIAVDAQGKEREEPLCGYTDPSRNLADIFGADDAINLLVGLPLRRLTPSYDVVGMLFADAILDSWSELDGGLGLLLVEADASMGLGLLTEEQRAASNYPVLMTPAQSADSLYGAGPFG